MTVEFGPKQEELAVALITTKTVAKVIRRRDLGNGQYELYTVDRETSPVDFTQTPEEFALTAHRVDIKLPLAPYYINLRNLPANLLSLVCETIAEKIPEEVRASYVLTGIPEAGGPLGIGVAKATNMELVNIFDKTDFSSARRFNPAPDAPRGEGRRLILVDDLITEAYTKMDAAEVARNLDYEVYGVAVLLDRQQGGVQQLKAAGYGLYVAYIWEDLLKFYREKSLIEPQQYQDSMAYFAKVKK